MKDVKDDIKMNEEDTKKFMEESRNFMKHVPSPEEHAKEMRRTQRLTEQLLKNGVKITQCILVILDLEIKKRKKELGA